MSSDAYEGGCFCGDVRYRVQRRTDSVAHCHCRDCREQTGAPIVTWIAALAADFAWTRGEPRAYQSRSDAEVTVQRTFCERCGTTLTYRRVGSDYVDITVASTDDPESFRPTYHAWAPRALSWMRLDDGLPRYEKGQPSPL